MDVKTGHDENGRIKFFVTSEKFNHKFEVRKSIDGFVFYEIGVSKGNLPAKLQGKYTTPEKALKDLTEYIRTASISTTKQRDRKTAIREKANAKRVQSDDKEHVQ